MTTKVTIKTTGEQFQIDVEPDKTVAELKAEISKSKGYATGAQKLIHSGRVLKDIQVFGTLGFKETDFMILLISKVTPQNPPPATTPSTIKPAELLDQTPSSTSSPPSLKGKEVIKNDEQSGNVAVSTDTPMVHRERPTVPSSLAQTISQPRVPSSSLPSWQPSVSPVPTQQRNYSQTPNGAQGGTATLGNMNDFASFTEMIRTNPSMRQNFIEMAGNHDPAFGQQLRENPGLLDSLIGMASARIGSEPPNSQDSALTAEEKESVQDLINLGFSEKKAIEAYLVSDKNKELAVNYLLSTNDESTPNDASDSESALPAPGEPSIGQLIREDPSLRQRLTQTITQQDPELAQRIKENPALLETVLQKSTVQRHALTFDESRAVQRLEKLGFTKQKALEAYVICGKNEEHAVNYLINNPDSADDSGIILSEENRQPIHNPTPQTTSQFESSSSLSSTIPARDTASPTKTIYLTVEDAEVIQRLMDCGFTEHQSVEAYLVSDKNEQVALNYLLDQE